MRRLMLLTEATSLGAIVSHVIETPEFKNWFRGSKIVDDHGKPLVVYHGTTAHFTAFSGDDAPDRGGIIAFFSTSPKFASDYATDNEGAHVIPCFLNIQNPFDFRKNWWWAESFWEDTGGLQDQWEINRILMGLGYHIKNIDDRDHGHELTQEMFVEAVKKGSWDALEAPEFVEYMREGGIDGIVTLENEAINFGIFEPTQVKSIYNFKFDPDNPDIGESSVGERFARHGRSWVTK